MVGRGVRVRGVRRDAEEQRFPSKLSKNRFRVYMVKNGQFPRKLAKVTNYVYVTKNNYFLSKLTKKPSELLSEGQGRR